MTKDFQIASYFTDLVIEMRENGLFHEDITFPDMAEYSEVQVSLQKLAFD